jgi:hypothetical protein
VIQGTRVSAHNPPSSRVRSVRRAHRDGHRPVEVAAVFLNQFFARNVHI